MQSINEKQKIFIKKKIDSLSEEINKKNVNYEKIQNAINELACFNKKAEYNYLNNLLYPEKCKGVKIPSPIPVPSCSFQLHNCVTLTTNSHGNLAIMFNPFFLASNVRGVERYIGTDSGLKYYAKPSFFSTFYVNNSDSLLGNSENDKWVPINIGQEIPPIYDQYRLVSASVVVKYIGRLDITSGVIGGAIIYDKMSEIGCLYDLRTESESGESWIDKNRVSRPFSLSKYGNFDLAMDSFYHQENLCLEGIRELYFPLDNLFKEYTKLMSDDLYETKLNLNDFNSPVVFYSDSDRFKDGFNQMIYVMGAPAKQSCFKVDIYCNFECLPKSEFLNYMPISSADCCSISTEKQKEICEIIQKKSINKP